VIFYLSRTSPDWVRRVLIKVHLRIDRDRNHVMCADEERAVGQRRPEPTEDDPRRFWVDASRWFVKQQNAGPAESRSRQTQPSTLATG
jgi:hypothetical protein